MMWFRYYSRPLRSSSVLSSVPREARWSASTWAGASARTISSEAATTKMVSVCPIVMFSSRDPVLLFPALASPAAHMRSHRRRHRRYRRGRPPRRFRPSAPGSRWGGARRRARHCGRLTGIGIRSHAASDRGRRRWLLRKSGWVARHRTDDRGR